MKPDHLVYGFVFAFVGLTSLLLTLFVATLRPVFGVALCATPAVMAVVFPVVLYVAGRMDSK